MNPIRLFVDAHLFDHGFEGAASFIHGLYLGLAKRYPGVFEINLGCANPEKVLAIFEGHPTFKALQYRSTNRFVRLAYDVPQAILRSKPHMAHFQYFTPLIKTCPWIVTIHDVLFNDFPDFFPPGYAKIRNLLFPLSASRADVLTTVSPYSRERIAAWYRVPADRINVVPNGVNAPPESMAPPSRAIAPLLAVSAGYFLCVSRFEPRKNQATLLRAFIDGRFWEKDIELVFVGSRTLVSTDFERTFDEAPSAAIAKVRFLEGLSFPDIQHLYANALAAIYPSLAEGFGIPPLEAAAVGTPSLCAENTAMRDFSALSPFFFDASDQQSLQSKMLGVVDDYDRNRAIASSITRNVLEEFSWDAAAGKFADLIFDYLKQHTQ